MSRFGMVAELEHRTDKPYDDLTPSSLIMPDGTVAATTDLALSCMMARLTYQTFEEQQ